MLFLFQAVESEESKKNMLHPSYFNHRNFLHDNSESFASILRTTFSLNEWQEWFIMRRQATSVAWKVVLVNEQSKIECCDQNALSGDNLSNFMQHLIWYKLHY
jgi:hypothetical protein